ncbi:putative acyl-CoA thioester hydrolase [Celerinatantimonas sp. YJH-8]|uniref:putative acyl-CoA thioester hydrolase n=1 Tax=Celerinatantimonas sp. YJH-8 TaxID=3228714 RepID=UPI0038CA52B9
MKHLIRTSLATSLLLTLYSVVAQAQTAFTAPGTIDSPILSDTEAATFTMANYFKFIGNTHTPEFIPWIPKPIQTKPVDITVAPASNSHVQFHDIQQAINAAIQLHPDSATPVTIRLQPGEYTGTVYIPEDAPPITLYGTGVKPTAVKITQTIDSMFTPEQYRNTVNPNNRYQSGDPAWEMYQTCATKTGTHVDTTCSAVVWSQSPKFQLKNLTIINSMIDQADASTHQAVALRTDGDQVQLEHVRLIGRQDTFFVNSSNRQNQYVTDHYSRAYIKDSYIEGDVDYVFGRASAVFDHVTFHSVSSRESNSTYIFAPDTPNWVDYGFLVIHSKLTCDNGFDDPTHIKLGRAWDQGASSTGYLPGTTSNGQLVIRDSLIENCFDLDAPWGNAATTSRPFSGNINPQRNLNDVHFNRLWLFHNTIMQTHW